MGLIYGLGSTGETEFARVYHLGQATWWLRSDLGAKAPILRLATNLVYQNLGTWANWLDNHSLECRPGVVNSRVCSYVKPTRAALRAKSTSRLIIRAIRYVLQFLILCRWRDDKDCDKSAWNNLWLINCDSHTGVRNIISDEMYKNFLFRRDGHARKMWHPCFLMLRYWRVQISSLSVHS